MKQTSYEKNAAAYVSDFSKPELVTAMIAIQAGNTLAAARSHGKVTADIRYNAAMVRPLFEADGLDDSLVGFLLGSVNAQFTILNAEKSGLDDVTKSTYWATYLATTGREFKNQGMVLKFSDGPQISKMEPGDNRFNAVSLEWKTEKKRAARTSPASKESNKGGDTKPDIKTIDDCRAAMAAWVRNGTITETQCFDMAVSLFEKETELAAAFAASGFLTKVQAAAKVSAAVTKERKSNYKTFAAEKAQLEARADSAVTSAKEIKARA